MSGAIEPVMDLVTGLNGVPGDFIELGVFRGDSFRLLAKAAVAQRKCAHAVDSFRGMGEPGTHDYTPDGACPYPAGKFDVNGPEGLGDRLAADGLEAGDYRLWVGYIPDVLRQLPADLALSLAFIDLDHYAPTRAAMAWAWGRLSPGGLMVCDDFLLDAERCLARLAIDEFIAARRPRVARIAGRLIVFERDRTADTGPEVDTGPCSVA